MIPPPLKPPTPADAKARRLVACPGGRTGRVVYVPIAREIRRSRPADGRAGNMARVRMPSGAFLSFPIEDLGVLPEAEQTQETPDE